MSRNDNKSEDLDAFLHGVESKLRGPYSSLEFSKSVTTPALRGNLSSKDYLRLVSETLSRPDKVVQMRILVGLLGLEPDKELDGHVHKIITQAQEGPLHEEWVRVIAGLVSGVMFVDPKKEEPLADESSIVRTCRGDEANALLDRTCQDIIDSVTKFEKETEPKPDDKHKSSILTTDMYPLFIPYRYSLLNPGLLEQVAPECTSNPHFQVNEDADALTKDIMLEKQKALEEKEHQMQQAQKKAAEEKSAESGDAKKEDQVFLPGGAKNKKPGAAAAKKIRATTQNNMFLKTKRPGIGVRPGMGRQPVKSVLHTRKAGAAKALLEQNRSRSLRTSGTGIGGAISLGGGGGRAAKLANAKSKMKMVDETEMEQLNQEHKKRAGVKLSREEKINARKRKIMEAAAQRGLVSRNNAKMQKTNQQKSRPQEDNNDDDNNNHDSSGFFDHEPPPATEEDFENSEQNAAPSSAKQQEWRHILNQRSNKLSAEDRLRVEQFFQDHYNPTPEIPIYKMKLHEERTTDPITNKEVKETYYLELDYSNFTSKQQKKIKRYD